MDNQQAEEKFPAPDTVENVTIPPAGELKAPLSPEEDFYRQSERELRETGLSEAQIGVILEAQRSVITQKKRAADMLSKPAFAAAASKISILSPDSEFEFKKDSGLTPSQRWAIACAADWGHRHALVLNDLTTGLTQSEARMMLEKMWNVTDYASYQAASDRLSRYEESQKYIAVAKNPEATGDLAESFAAAFAMYKRQGLIETDAVPSMTAWDLCRQIALARLAFDSEILSHDEAMRVVTDTAKLLKLSYSSWKGLSVGWQFGSLMRGGFSEDAARLLQADMHELLTLPDSPWVQMPFTMPLGF